MQRTSFEIVSANTELCARTPVFSGCHGACTTCAVNSDCRSHEASQSRPVSRAFRLATHKRQISARRLTICTPTRLNLQRRCSDLKQPVSPVSSHRRCSVRRSWVLKWRSLHRCQAGTSPPLQRRPMQIWLIALLFSNSVHAGACSWMPQPRASPFRPPSLTSRRMTRVLKVRASLNGCQLATCTQVACASKLSAMGITATSGSLTSFQTQRNQIAVNTYLADSQTPRCAGDQKLQPLDTLNILKCRQFRRAADAQRHKNSTAASSSKNASKRHRDKCAPFAGF